MNALQIIAALKIGDLASISTADACSRNAHADNAALMQVSGRDMAILVNGLDQIKCARRDVENDDIDDCADEIMTHQVYLAEVARLTA